LRLPKRGFLGRFTTILELGESADTQFKIEEVCGRLAPKEGLPQLPMRLERAHLASALKFIHARAMEVSS